ncbi:trna1 adenine-n6-methyltransferase [Lasius niger]|uniref:Trna1 adenine-n6-methyltransferase n=1 Tax=Lasius niger TaxID=67767 RepID=A0A0J7K2B2_LASNI|nr:trna1 adenine-n6-methyltransferase [Lasius niger]
MQPGHRPPQALFHASPMAGQANAAPSSRPPSNSGSQQARQVLRTQKHQRAAAHHTTKLSKVAVIARSIGPSGNATASQAALAKLRK